MSAMETTINRNTLKHAVGRMISCPDCDTVLDYRKAVLLSTDRAAGIACTDCFDAMGHNTDDLIEAGVEVIDGREL
jgi:hypothetical protein